MKCIKVSTQRLNYQNLPFKSNIFNFNPYLVLFLPVIKHLRCGIMYFKFLIKNCSIEYSQSMERLILKKMKSLNSKKKRYPFSYICYVIFFFNSKL